MSFVAKDTAILAKRFDARNWRAGTADDVAAYDGADLCFLVLFVRLCCCPLYRLQSTTVAFVFHTLQLHISPIEPYSNDSDNNHQTHNPPQNNNRNHAFHRLVSAPFRRLALLARSLTESSQRHHQDHPRHLPPARRCLPRARLRRRLPHQHPPHHPGLHSRYVIKKPFAQTHKTKGTSSLTTWAI